MSNTYERLFEHVQTLTLIDSHEHLEAWEHKREKNTDILYEYLFHYMSSDLVAAGMPYNDVQAARDVTKPLLERWKSVEPYWQLCRNTGYARALDTTVKALYGAERIDGDTIEGLNTAFLQTLKPDANHYRKVLKDLSNIEYCMLDEYPDVDTNFFRPVFGIDNLYCPTSWAKMDSIEAETGIPVSTLDGWVAAVEKCLQDALDNGMNTFKCHCAYWRPLQFDLVTHETAQAAYNELLTLRGRAPWNAAAFQCPKPLQDYLMHRIMRFANEHGMTAQIHTGLQEGGNNYITNADPSPLINLFVLYPHVRFDIFHIGYPYQHMLGALAKMFPNVYLDMCWAHIISPAACVTALDEWLDSVPVSKIIGFGGDYSIIDAVYAHQLMARENVTKVLAKKVDEGIFNLEDAKWMARRIFYDNPKSIYER